MYSVVRLVPNKHIYNNDNNDIRNNFGKYDEYDEIQMIVFRFTIKSITHNRERRDITAAVVATTSTKATAATLPENRNHIPTTTQITTLNNNTPQYEHPKKIDDK